MSYRLLLFLMVVCLAATVFLMVTPVQKLGAMGGLSSLPEIPVPKTPKSIAKLELEAPLGLLVLDQSGSMIKMDPEFIQTLASEIFVYFFAHLIKEDVAPASTSSIHFATLLYPHIDNDEAINTPGRDLSVLTWPSSINSDSRWLHIEATPSGASKASEILQQRFEEVMGKPGSDRRRGQVTPHRDVGPAVATLTKEYRQQMGDNAEIFVVYMTDAGEDPDFLPAQEYISQNVPGVQLAAAPLEHREDADQLIPDFLRALRLDEIDVTKTAKGDGFDLETFNGRPVPFLVSSRSKPEVTTDTGAIVPVYGRNGLYYGLCDPKDAAFTGARLLKVRSDRGLTAIHVFRRPWWELKLEPHYYDMLDEDAIPRAILSYISDSSLNNPQPKVATVTTKDGQIIADIALNWDSSSRSFIGNLPAATAFPTTETEFVLICKQDQGAELRLPFTALRTVRLRYVDKTTGKSSLTADHLSFFPMHQKP